MDPATLRLLWSIVEATQAADLLTIGDRELIEQLLNQLHRRKVLSSEEAGKVTGYLQPKLSLIRDLAEARVA
ncbi:hypothetical protein IFO70_05215 [Phormidium tenue FACHB-886]|nr:hypothetical protein [Phormidium tenue FACHB-886]